jgi:UDP-3-O-[3-hydroxymyristoyl] N-acetylglucosamine deacetylase
LSGEVFETDIAGARTFGFLNEYEYLKRYGFAQGASLDNVVVIDKNQVLNPDGLRYPDEFVRHKMLDCLGDFSLLGMPILGRIVAEKSGHAFHFNFLNTFFSRKDAWETKNLADLVCYPEPQLKELAI